MPPRQQARTLERLPEPAHLHRPRPRVAHVRGARGRRRRQLDPTPAGYAWTILDGTPPETTIDSGPPATTTEHERDLRLLVERGRLDLRVLARRRRRSRPAPRRVSYTGLGVGDHSFRVRATDAAGLVDDDARELRVDDRGAAGHDRARDDDRRRPGRPTTAQHRRELTFSRTSRADLRVLARRRRVQRRAPRRFSFTNLALGAHTLRVRATDAAGNIDPTPAIRSWTITAAARDDDPDRARPTPMTESTSATFTFEADQPARPSSARSTSDLASTPAPRGVTYTGLAMGAHEFLVRAQRRRRQRRPDAGRVQLGDRRHHAAGRHDHRRPGDRDHGHDRDLHVHVRRPGRPSSSARSTAPRSSSAVARRRTPGRSSPRRRARSPGAHTFEVQRPRAAPARRPGPGRSGSGRSRTTPRPRRRSSDAPARPVDGRPAARRSRSLEQRARRDLRVLARRRSRSASCASPPEQLPSSATSMPGAHTLQVRAVDPSLNVDATPRVVQLDGRRPAGHDDHRRPGRRRRRRRPTTRPRRSRSPPTRPRRPTSARSTAPGSRRARRRSPTPRPSSRHRADRRTASHGSTV